MRTTRISWPSLDPYGRIPQSEAVVVDERFFVDPAMDQLIYELTVTDPATLTEPVTMSAVYDWHPELVVEPFECTSGDWARARRWVAAGAHDASLGPSWHRPGLAQPSHGVRKSQVTPFALESRASNVARGNSRASATATYHAS